jgi:DNA helicase-2/ATP-dependent DNA helicase PcrA
LLTTGRAKPWSVLAVTFTNKAAREMRERVEKLLGPGGGGLPWLGTFHSISARMLRTHAELVGLKNNFSILDTDDQVRLLKQIIEAEGIDEKRWPGRQLAGVIDGWKNRALTPEKVPKNESFSFADGGGVKLYAIYQARLKILNACDFGDLLMHMIDIFQRHPDVLEAYHKKLSHLMVDEYQDTNVAQYLWLRCWRRRARICAWSATTISRSMAGAAPRSITSCASSTIFRALKLCGWSRIIARRATSSRRPRI